MVRTTSISETSVGNFHHEMAKHDRVYITSPRKPGTEIYQEDQEMKRRNGSATPLQLEALFTEWMVRVKNGWLLKSTLPFCRPGPPFLR